MTTIPTSSTERWDQLAESVKAAKGKWVLVDERPVQHKSGKNAKVRENLARRGLEVEVMSRIGHATDERPWVGWRTWARTI